MIINKLLESNLNSLWYKTELKLSPIEKDFKNRLNALFSKQQKHIIQKIKADDFDSIDYDLFSEKFSDLYIDNTNKVSHIAVKRVSSEIEKEVRDDIREAVVNTYVIKYIPSIASIVIRTTKKNVEKIVNSYKKQEISKNELIENINDYFNNDCKKRRSKLISITEVYRVYNFTYLNIMAMYGYYYKIYIARPNTDCEVCKKLNLQKKFFAEHFDISNIDRKDIIENTLFPPVHVNSKAILLCVKK